MRWLLLETPAPDESIVAAARLKAHPAEHGCGLVDVLAAAAVGEFAGGGEAADEGGAIRMLLLKQLLQRAEQVAYNSNFSAGLVVQVPQWRCDIIAALDADGAVAVAAPAAYREIGGCMWPAEEEHLLLWPTMLFEFRKSFTAAATTAADVVAAAAAASSGARGKDSDVHPLFNNSISCPQHSHFACAEVGPADAAQQMPPVPVFASGPRIDASAGEVHANHATVDAIAAAFCDWTGGSNSTSGSNNSGNSSSSSSGGAAVTELRCVAEAAEAASATGLQRLDGAAGDEGLVSQLDLIDRTLLQLVNAETRTASAVVAAAATAGAGAEGSPNSTEAAPHQQARTGPLEDERLLRTLFAALHAEYDPRSDDA